MSEKSEVAAKQWIVVDIHVETGRQEEISHIERLAESVILRKGIQVSPCKIISQSRTNFYQTLQSEGTNRASSADPSGGYTEWLKLLKQARCVDSSKEENEYFVMNLSVFEESAGRGLSVLVDFSSLEDPSVRYIGRNSQPDGTYAGGSLLEGIEFSVVHALAVENSPPSVEISLGGAPKVGKDLVVRVNVADRDGDIVGLNWHSYVRGCRESSDQFSVESGNTFSQGGRLYSGSPRLQANDLTCFGWMEPVWLEVPSVEASLYERKIYLSAPYQYLIAVEAKDAAGGISSSRVLVAPELPYYNYISARWFFGGSLSRSSYSSDSFDTEWSLNVRGVELGIERILELSPKIAQDSIGLPTELDLGASLSYYYNPLFSTGEDLPPDVEKKYAGLTLRARRAWYTQFGEFQVALKSGSALKVRGPDTLQGRIFTYGVMVGWGGYIVSRGIRGRYYSFDPGKNPGLHPWAAYYTLELLSFSGGFDELFLNLGMEIRTPF